MRIIDNLNAKRAKILIEIIKASKIMKDNGEREILEFLKEKKSATIDELTAALYLSPSSIRRKLNALQDKGLIRRTHGGAKIADDNEFFPTFSFRSEQNSFEKKNIAHLATSLIKDGDLIFLDGSTTAFFIADFLGNFNNIRVVTNGIDTISLLSKNGGDAVSTGGKISERNRAVLVGQSAVNTIENYHADVMFFSAHAVDKRGGIYDCFEEENYVRRAMMERAEKRVFLIDGSKTDRTSSYYLCSVNDVTHIVSDTDLTDYFDRKPSCKFIW